MKLFLETELFRQKIVSHETTLTASKRVVIRRDYRPTRSSETDGYFSSRDTLLGTIKTTLHRVTVQVIVNYFVLYDEKGHYQAVGTMQLSLK